MTKTRRRGKKGAIKLAKNQAEDEKDEIDEKESELRLQKDVQKFKLYLSCTLLDMLWRCNEPRGAVDSCSSTCLDELPSVMDEAAYFTVNQILIKLHMSWTVMDISVYVTDELA
jgi:hypothetical protein